ncbi:4'-phosphopantetheinyl transferase family protein [Nitrosospira multiformis]|uniref:4'-phosphopantetheinyl transferase family protein n=1 Tax=Nitrosospira multiformis TaxID=1231 RepID=UPI0008965A78|nr:4'-phosphopantetheinyl transferase superfamily protein [Nitrosospira multiformis]SDZ98673.1 4'-phosphopantetheinyl transferase [Nitrosospira multiformis]
MYSIRYPLRSPIRRLPLSERIPDGMEVWLLELDVGLSVPDAELALLSAEERAHAQRFRRQEDRVRSVATRAALRRLVGARLMLPPDQLRFVVNAYGKPRLEGEPEIEFNVSHAGCCALIALSTSGPVGVDIECEERVLDAKNLEELAAYVFSPLERHLALQTSKDFIRHWVAKESVLKALGLGISEHLQSVSILPRDDEAYQIAHDSPEWPEIQAWRLPVSDGYAAALAFQTHDRASTQGKSREVSRQTSWLPLSSLEPCQDRGASPQACDHSVRQIDHA